MRELQGLFDWLNSLNGPEKGCDSLIAWLELERRAAYERNGQQFARGVMGLVGGLVSGAAVFLVANLIMIWLGIHILGPQAGLAAVLAVAGVVGGGIAASRFYRPRLKLSSPDRDAEALDAIARLRNFHNYRMLRRELGEHGVTELEEGAQLYLRCRTTLSQSTWSGDGPENPWREARHDLLRAMDAAMDRLTLLVVRKRSFTEIGPVLDEMRAAANEVQRITDGRASAAASGRDLRASLARMKELAAAEEEILQIQERP